jgi:methyl-accepting chemotaxis protein
MTNEDAKNKETVSPEWFEQLDNLANQTKMLALNLAISLAKAKEGAKELAYLEPEFTKLIHGSVEVIKEITAILKTARNEDKMIYSPPVESGKPDRIETSLNEILSQSQTILKAISEIKKRRGKVDNYK